MPDPTALQETAVRAARAGAAALRPFLPAGASLEVNRKSEHDFVTAADLASERAITAQILHEHSDHRVLAEEERRAELNGPGVVWIVDPLDGTTNFIHGFPVFAVSVACAAEGRVLAGAVLDPTREELFAAARGRGAMLNGAPIHVSPRRRLAEGLIGTGFPFRRLHRTEEYLNSFRAVLADTAGIRRAGSAALDLAAVAAGRFDGFWEEGLGPWDMAAGALLIEEAGGVVTDFQGGDRYLETGAIVAGAPGVQQELRARIEPHLGPGR